MKVQCVICDVIETIDNHSPLAKKLRNRPIHTHMCNKCEERITERTNERIASGNFQLYRPRKKEDDWI